MTSSKRFLIGFSIAIVVLAAAAISIALLTQGNNIVLEPENTPQGTVQRFLIAIQDKDYPKAYSYLKVETKNQPMPYTYSDFLNEVTHPWSTGTAWKATLSKTTVTGDSATVEVIVDTLRPGGPFQDPVNTQTVTFQMTKVDNTWYVSNPYSLWWLY